VVARHFYHLYHFYHFFFEKYPLEETYNCNLWRLSSKKVVELVGMRLMVATRNMPPDTCLAVAIGGQKIHA